jgi:hypothetical protein
MTDPDAAARAEILARLASSRAELRRVLEPPPDDSDDSSKPGDRPDGFPRSRTMKMIMSGGGLGTLGAAAAGLLIARPRLALRLLRLVPAGAIAKTLLMRAMMRRTK